MEVCIALVVEARSVSQISDLCVAVYDYKHMFGVIKTLFICHICPFSSD